MSNMHVLTLIDRAVVEIWAQLSQNTISSKNISEQHVDKLTSGS